MSLETNFDITTPTSALNISISSLSAQPASPKHPRGILDSTAVAYNTVRNLNAYRNMLITGADVEQVGVSLHASKVMLPYLFSFYNDSMGLSITSGDLPDIMSLKRLREVFPYPARVPGFLTRIAGYNPEHRADISAVALVGWYLQCVGSEQAQINSAVQLVQNITPDRNNFINLRTSVSLFKDITHADRLIRAARLAAGNTPTESKLRMIIEIDPRMMNPEEFNNTVKAVVLRWENKKNADDSGVQIAIEFDPGQYQRGINNNDIPNAPTFNKHPLIEFRDLLNNPILGSRVASVSYNPAESKGGFHQLPGKGLDYVPFMKMYGLAFKHEVINPEHLTPSTIIETSPQDLYNILTIHRSSTQKALWDIRRAFDQIVDIEE
jgi:hypothetical protein